jgi:hypothetical protein
MGSHLVDGKGNGRGLKIPKVMWNGVARPWCLGAAIYATIWSPSMGNRMPSCCFKNWGLRGGDVINGGCVARSGTLWSGNLIQCHVNTSHLWWWWGLPGPGDKEVEDVFGASDLKGTALEAEWSFIERKHMKMHKVTEGEKWGQGRNKGDDEVKRRHTLYMFVFFHISYPLFSIISCELETLGSVRQ